MRAPDLGTRRRCRRARRISSSRTRPRSPHAIGSCTGRSRFQKSSWTNRASRGRTRVRRRRRQPAVGHGPRRQRRRRRPRRPSDRRAPVHRLRARGGRSTAWKAARTSTATSCSWSARCSSRGQAAASAWCCRPGWSTDAGAAPLRRHLFDHADVDTVTGLDNRGGIFPIHRSLRFVLLTATTGRPTRQIACRFGARAPVIPGTAGDPGRWDELGRQPRPARGRLPPPVPRPPNGGGPAPLPRHAHRSGRRAARHPGRDGPFTTSLRDARTESGTRRRRPAHDAGGCQ